MNGKIAFEEHVAIDETLEETRAFAGESADWSDFAQRILDVDNQRLDGMDENGIEYAILSLNSPGVQAILDTARAIKIARKGNDRLAEATVRHPNRYGAFAALPMQDPEAASLELTRCVKKMGFKGAMLNGFTQKDTPETALYYDMPEFREFWATVSELDVPVYLHPRMQIPSRSQNYEGHPWLQSAPWGFAVETSIHALRLCGSGIFESYPNLKIVLGHFGENIPFGLARMDERMRFSRRGYRGKKLLGEYFREHFHVTTSGNFDDPAFRCTLEVMGQDRVYFSSYYPFEAMESGCNWFDSTNVITPAEKQRIGRANALKLFGIELSASSSVAPKVTRMAE